MKLWLDSVECVLEKKKRALGDTGETSNPIIISGLIKAGEFDKQIDALLSEKGLSDEEVAWRLTDQVVRSAQDVFRPVWESTKGNDGYVSFELDPLLEDPDNNIPHDERVARYIELGLKWFKGHDNRMIKVPA